MGNIEHVRSCLPEANPKVHYMGVPLEEFTKEDLMRIVCALGQQMVSESQSYAETLDKVGELLVRKS